MRIELRRRSAWLVASVVAAGAVLAGPAAAQVPPLGGSETTTATTTTPPPQPSSSPEEPSGSDFSGSNQAPAGAQDAGGDGAPAPSEGIRVPAEAQRIIDSVVRTGASSSDPLLEALAPVEALGLPRDGVLRLGMGRFPIAGPARYSHDWLFPRYGPGFRFHLGTDVFAPYGTPVRAPVDGIAKSANGGLGGLTVKVYMDDGTYFYLAHLSGLPEGFVDGMAVKTGDIVGFVGDSGNARGTPPHLHIGIYPKGGPAVDPKPILDGFLMEALARVPALVEAVQASRPAPEPAPVGAAVTEPAADVPTLLRPMLHRAVLRALDDALSAAGWWLT
jgi:murein DD-endopeptidase MepM/ murein hydrolase activator NlpD